MHNRTGNKLLIKPSVNDWCSGISVVLQQSVSMGNAPQHHQQMLGVAVEFNAPFDTI